MTERIIGDLIDSNVFVISKDDECIIVDAGTPSEKVAAVVANKNVLAVLLTHGHYDHTYYVMDYLNHFGCKAYCSKEAMQYLQNPDYNYSEGKFKIDEFSKFEFLTGQGKLRLGGFEIDYHQLGGHSLGDMCFLLDDDVFVGDVLIGRDMGRIDLYGGDKKEMLNSLEFLLGLKYSVMHSGHGQDNEKAVQDKVIALWQRFLSR